MEYMGNKMTDNAIVPELTNGEFEEFTKEGLAVVDFFAEWCMPCLVMAPVIEELAEKLKGKVKFGKVNVEDNQALAQKFNVSSIPNIFILKNGKVVGQSIGSVSSEDLEEKLKKFM